jgi:hypothetical protein
MLKCYCDVHPITELHKTHTSKTKQKVRVNQRANQEWTQATLSTQDTHVEDKTKS